MSMLRTIKSVMWTLVMFLKVMFHKCSEHMALSLEYGTALQGYYSEENITYLDM